MEMKKTAMLALGAAMAVTGPAAMIVSPLTALADDSAPSAYEVPAVGHIVTGSATMIPSVQGEFTFDQGVVTDNERIKTVFQKAATALCQKRPLYIAEADESWDIVVGGDVRHGFEATISEMQKAQEESSMLLSCACATNGAGGSAMINAVVSGISIADVATLANAAPDANAVTFTGADGTSETLPLSYLLTHDAVVATEINDERVSEFTGAVNQLWMANTSDEYFVSDIVDIAFAAEEQLPLAPM